MKKQQSKAIRIIAVILLIAGTVLAVVPLGFKTYFRVQADDNVEAFEVAAQSGKYDRLRQAMIEYNENLYLSGQRTLVDQESYETPDFNPADYGAPSDILCYVSVPSKNIKLPVYNGASEENMSKGAVYLAKTSLPVGGNNTNCVIAAHNIFYGVKMFYRISELEPGDKIYITNYWETLEYEVISKEIAERNESRRLFIQPNKELLTLSTCYRPTRQINQRYIVCAQRVTEQNGK